MQLAPWITEQIRDGQAILFLGAGAVKGAVGPNNERPLTGIQLRDKLSDKFLGGSQKDKVLSQVAEFAKYDAGIIEVQRYIKTLFEPLQPASFHLLIPRFRWYAIITTNYDFVLERAYDQSNNPLQRIAPIIRNGDRFTEAISDPENVPYLKLHGCLSVTTDENLPLILATEEYAKHRKNRDRLFDHFQDWAREHPVIFCGYDLGDPNIQQILFDLGDEAIHRQQFATVTPSLDEIATRYWSARRVQPLRLTFEEFITGIDSEIPEYTRQLAVLVDQQAPSIQSWIQEGIPTNALRLYLDGNLQHIYRDMPLDGVKPKDFYSGAGNNWGAIKSQLDVERRITDDVLLEAVLDASEDPIPQLFLIKGHAGSGKSITLRRIAWNAATEQKRLVVWLEEGAYIRPDLLAELCRLTKERLFLFLDDVIPHLRDLRTLLKRARSQNLPITIIFAARSNEWNVSGDYLDTTLSKEYELRDLSEREITKILSLLESHGCLGELQYLPPEERGEFFRLTADRQLLVALHEATLGKSFTEIVLDEYNNIVPAEAKLLYQDVCTLHRFKVGVRAGLLSRVSGVTFDYFGKTLLKPLEHVVFVYFDSASRDYAYRTRHPIIADLVFRQVLKDPEQRANQIVRIISCMNIDYSSDQTAFEQMIRGRELAELFSDRMYVDRIFEAAKRAQANASHIEHQRAVFELHHSAGSSRAALRAILEAEKALGHSTNALRHTHALALRKLANESDNALERDKLRSDAKQILERLVRRQETSHGLHTLGQIWFDELAERLKGSEETEIQNEELDLRIISELTTSLDDLINRGRQRFPNESYLLDLEAKYAKLVNDAPRALNALARAHSINPENGFVAVRLAKYYEEHGDVEQAKTVLSRCIEGNPSSRPAHLQFAKLLIDENEHVNLAAITSHLNSSFTEGDTNYDAQFWCARYEYLFGDRIKAKRLFNALSSAKVAPRFKQQARGLATLGDGSNQRFSGVVTQCSDSYCFVETAEIRDSLFAHYSVFSESDWDALAVGKTVLFDLGFNFRGPICVRATTRD